MSRPPLLPIAIDVSNARVVVIGGGGVALRKARTLVEHGAHVVVIAPEVGEDFDTLEGRIEIVRRKFERDDLAGARFVFAATNHCTVNEEVATAARAAGIAVNVADAPELCDFTLPASVERGDIRIAVMTGGSSPALAQRIRDEIERVIGPEYGRLNVLLGSIRDHAKSTVADGMRRRELFHSIASREVLDALANRDGATTVALVSQKFRSAGVEAPDDLERIVRALLAT